MKADKFLAVLKSNAVTIFFIILCIFSTAFSGQSATFIVQELVSRLCRNSVLILSLLMPVLCGMGLNFSIVLGAAAGQIGLILITNWGIGGFTGMLVCILIATIISVLFGIFSGFLFNKTVGQEMITGIIVGYFAKGFFDLIFLILAGTKIFPIGNPELLLAGGVGLKNTIVFGEGVRYVFDDVFKLSLINCILYGVYITLAITIVVILIHKIKGNKWKDVLIKSKTMIIVFSCFLICFLLVFLIPSLFTAGLRTDVPLFTVLLIAVVCLLNEFLCKTKLGQDIRTCGLDMQVASASGIKVGQTRIIATVISTIIAAWGQIIFLQNMGLVNTYTSHEQVGTYAVAALLVGGASIHKATIKQVFVGAVLFHLLFFTMPLAGFNLFNDSQIGEYFRVFVSYGVIAISLALHAWENLPKVKAKKKIKSDVVAN